MDCVCLLARRSVLLLGAWGLVAAVAPALLVGAEITLRDGRVLRGKLAPISSIAESPASVSPEALVPIVLVDNGLTRTFVPKRLVEHLSESDSGEVPERFPVRQEMPSGGFPIAGVGPIIKLQPFDEYGRRILSMHTMSGPLDVIQGITEVTPTWTKVEALRQYKWDMRLATSSIPRETLDTVLKKRIDPKNLNQRLKVVRLYLQSERYQDARKELDEVIADFPDHREQFEPVALRLRQLGAQRLLTEIRLRRACGQHQMSHTMLSQFPADGVAGEILQEVRELLDEYQEQYQRYEGLLKRLEAHAAELTDASQRERLTPALDEIKAELNINTLERLAAYQQLGETADLLPAEKLALATSGWLLGRDGATEKLEVALSLYQTRQLVHEYFNEPVKLNREALLGKLKGQEGASPANVARLLAHMKPPLDTPSPQVPGYYTLSIPGLGNNAPITYHVQLPPEYDPYRRYPTIVTLHGAGTTAGHQIDWWAGAQGENGQRLGQAMRHGYIVVAPEWAREHQKEYRYTAAEHAAVLNSLRDACKRFSIDTDRVFLSGHSMGGDAAWDLALGHPDLWAGVIPIVAVSDKYCALYWENARGLPLYFVGGELDGDKSVRNARDLDRYLTRLGFDVTVVEYLGRGHEHFSDEILNLFDWMGRRRRNFFPREFTARTMRPWDNFFWWLELADLPERTMVDPAQWPPPRGVIPMVTEGSLLANNNIRVKTGAGRVTVWISPEMIDFNQPAQVSLNGSRLGSGRFIEPDLEVLLEDVRTRGDRQHPFWAKLQSPAGRGRVARGR